MRERQFRSDAIGNDSRIHRTRVNDSYYDAGVVLTRNGYVAVYSDPSVSTFRFIWRGREATMTDWRGHSERGLAILARRFARDVMNGLVAL